MVKKAAQILVLIIGMLIIAFLMRPVPIDLDSSESVEGIVLNVEENAYQDIVIRLKDNKSFYINRGLEKQFKPGELGNALKGLHVSIVYADSWGTSSHSAKHIIQLSANGKELYSELKAIQ